MVTEESIELRMTSGKVSELEEEATLLATGDVAQKRKRGAKFWLVILSATICSFAGAYDTYGPSTALPIIAQDLDAKENAIWIASAAQLTTLAFTPLASGAADIWGRRVALLITLAFFITGNLLSALSWNMTTMICGRGIQGVGVAALLALPVTLVTDVCTMQERAIFVQFIGGSWAMGSLVCPLISGWVAEISWRLLFLLAAALGVGSVGLIWRYLDVKTPEESAMDKVSSIDGIGLSFFVGATMSICWAFTTAGSVYAWSSWHVIVPLVAGALGFALFGFYEARFASRPLMPPILFSNRTAICSYLGTAIQTFALAISVYFTPIYWQAVRLVSPQRSGALLFPLLLVAEATGIVTGFWLAWRKRYWSSVVAAWPFMICGAIALAMLDRRTPVSAAILAEVCFGIGLGILADVYLFPVLSSFPDKLAGAIVGLNSVFRATGAVLMVLGSTILSNGLLGAPSSYLASLPRNADGTPRIEFAAIERITHLPAGEREAVQDAYAKSLRSIWWLVAALSVVGLISALAMESLPFREQNTSSYGVREETEDDEKLT